ncbi:hypothetical protein BGW80DRAFT_528472 [Lactifluus volemus]|nr:hypothetical protein BGW80DRAFT_528472 [Lactifluus volemus]
MELRKDYGNPNIGSCWESPVGSNHLRMFRQNGFEANTGALFLAVSEEDNVFDGHNITEDGYNRGRDSLVQDALRVNLKRYRSINYHITAKCISGMIPPGSDGINQGIAIDGVVTLLTVTVVE